MAKEAASFTVVDNGSDPLFIRQAYYWIIKVANEKKAAEMENNLMIFSTEEKALLVIDHFDLKCVAEVMFWEEIVADFQAVCLQAIINFSGDVKKEVECLDLLFDHQRYRQNAMLTC
jgi:hypothetical protein